MPTFFPLIFLAATWPLRAAPAPAARQTIERFERKLRHRAAEDCAACEVSHAGRDDADWRQCISELCPDGFGALGKAFAKAGELMRREPAPEFRQQLERSAKSLIRSRLKDISAIRKAIAENRRIKNPSALRMMRFARLSTVTAKEASPEELEIIEKFARYSVALKAQGPLDLPVEILSAITTPERLGAMLSRARDDLRASDRRLLTKTRIQDSANALALQEAEKPFTTARYAFVQENLKSSRFMEYVLDSTDFLATGEISVAGDFGPRDRMLYTQEKILRRHLDGDLTAGTDALANTLRRELTNCTAGHYANRYFAPTAAQNEAYRARFPRIRERYLEGLKSKLSIDSARKLGQAAQEWTPALPSPFDVQSRDYMQGLALLEKSRDDYANSLEAAGQDNPDYTLALQIANGLDAIQSVGAELSRVCTRHTTYPIRDARLPGRNELVVGPLAVINEKFGEVVAPHEFGHFVSALFAEKSMSETSTKWFTRVRTCLANVPGHAHLEEEDSADYLAARSGATPFACQTIADQESSFTLLNAPKDDHSSNLYRIMAARHLQGRDLPRVCAAAIATRGLKFEVCALENESKAAAE